MMLLNNSTPGLVDPDMSVVPGGAAYLNDIERRLAPYFERAEPRQRVMAYLRGLLSPAERKNSWQLAKISGDATPDAFQHLLRWALWDPEAVRDELRRYVLQHLGDPEAVLVIDETGFLKKGRHSAGVARQYSGTAGKVDNCQIGVFLGYARALGHALLDRELYLPEEWTDDRDRCQQAGIPEDRPFATKPQLARQLLARAFAAGMPARWVTGDSVYGNDRRWLPLAEPLEPDWRRWLLVRRSVSDSTDLTASGVFAPQETTLEAVVRVAGTRWTMESSFEAAKGEVGLDHDEVRSWTGWYRHMPLAMWAYALLTVLRAGTIAMEALKKLPL